MFLLYAIKNQLTAGKKEPVTSGSVNAYQAQFEFSSDWDGLRKIAIFQAGCKEKSVDLDETGTCQIPWEVLVEPGRKLMAGVCGLMGDKLVLPTVWADLGMIAQGAVNSAPLSPPTPELWERALSKKGDRLDYTDNGELGLWSGDQLLSSAPLNELEGQIAPDEDIQSMLNEVFQTVEK